MPAIAQRAPQEATRSYRPPREVAELTCEALFGPLSTLEARYAPPCLWVAGDPGLAQATLRVSIVGSRKASAEGRRRATKLAGQLANAGVVIVSGLAEGIDDAAHRAAIDAGGRTIAVIGTTLERCYPPKQAALQTKIYQDHLLVSQFDPRQPTYPSGFVKRNRLMALMSQASVVVEAGDSSGTLSQAAETVRLGRPLFIMRSLAERRDLDWPARFIAKGAIVLDDVEQVISALSVQQTIARATVDAVPVPLVLPGCEIA